MKFPKIASTKKFRILGNLPTKSLIFELHSWTGKVNKIFFSRRPKNELFYSRFYYVSVSQVQKIISILK